MCNSAHSYSRPRPLGYLNQADNTSDYRVKLTQDSQSECLRAIEETQIYHLENFKVHQD